MTHAEPPPARKSTPLLSLQRWSDAPEVRRLASTPSLKKRKVKIGIWDIGAQAGLLPSLLSEINATQSILEFHAVLAPTPSGLVTPGVSTFRGFARFVDRLKEYQLQPFDFAQNVDAGPVWPWIDRLRRAETVRCDWMIAIVGPMLADFGDPKDPVESLIADPYANLFSTWRPGLAMVSTFDLALFAGAAGRTYEAAVMYVAVAALLRAGVPGVEYREQTTGSLFDLCLDRNDIIRGLKRPAIDPLNSEALHAYSPRLLRSVLSILKVLASQSMQAGTTKARKSARARSAGASDKSSWDVLADLYRARKALADASPNVLPQEWTKTAFTNSSLAPPVADNAIIEGSASQVASQSTRQRRRRRFVEE